MDEAWPVAGFLSAFMH